MKKFLPTIKTLIIGLVLSNASVNLHAQNICAAGISISPTSSQNICVQSSASMLFATVTTSGSGAQGNIIYNWYRNSINSNSGGTLVQTLTTNTGTLSNSYTPPTSESGTHWYYCTVTNDGGDCGGTNFITATVQVTVNELPAIYNVSGGGTRCSNGPGLAVNISNSQTGVKYQLLKGGSAIGGSLSGLDGHSFGFVVTTAGIYSIRATNATTGCVSLMNGSATIITNAAPAATYTKTDVSCNGGDGTLTVTGSGGTPQYLFNVDGGSFSSSNVFSGLSTGNHSIGVKDANSCSVIVSNIAISTAPPLSLHASSVNPGDCSGSGGSISVSSAGGVNDGIIPIQYKLDGDATRPYQNSNVFQGLSKGDYTVTVKDSRGCTAVSSEISLTQVAGTVPSVFNVSGGGTRCSDGSGISIFLSGSETGVKYQLERGSSPVGTSLSGTTGSPLSFLVTTAGTYTILATNVEAGCTNLMSGSATIVVNPAPALYNVTGGGARCSNSSGIPIKLTNSETGVKYQLFNGGSPVGTALSGSTGHDLSFIVSTAGAFTMVATNNSTSCTSVMNGSATVVVNQAPAIYNITGGGVICSGASGISIGLSGSQSGINYQLNKGGSPVGTIMPGTESTLTFVVNTPATYLILATDPSSGCINYMLGNAVVTQNAAITPTYTKYYASSCVGGDGTITVTGRGGTPGYLYNIDDGPFSDNSHFTNLPAGDHKIVVKDANSCTFTYQGITVLTAPIMAVHAGGVNPGVCTGNDGAVAATGIGGNNDGITPFEYMLNGDITRPFQSSNSFGGLPPGNYSVTIKDSKGCLAESNVVTLASGGAPITLLTTSYSTNVSSCGTGSDGSISTSITGGSAPYTYKINGSIYTVSNSQFLKYANLSVGMYTIDISDRSGCTVSRVFNIGQAVGTKATVAYQGNETCIGANNGFITLSPTGNGGIPGYSFSKDGGVSYQSSSSFKGLPPSTYQMVVKDSKGCSSAPVGVTISAGKANCFAGKTGNRSVNKNENRVGATTGDEISKNTDLNSLFSVKASPNPFVSEFILDVKGNNKEMVSLVVTDVLGRRIYQTRGNANQQYKIGKDMRKGIYIVQVVQGDKVKTLKIIKE